MRILAAQHPGILAARHPGILAEGRPTVLSFPLSLASFYVIYHNHDMAG